MDDRSARELTTACPWFAIIPLATQVHHRSKRLGADLLEQTEWLAVLVTAPCQIDYNKAWAWAGATR